MRVSQAAVGRPDRDERPASSVQFRRRTVVALRTFKVPNSVLRLRSSACATALLSEQTGVAWWFKSMVGSHTSWDLQTPTIRSISCAMTKQFGVVHRDTDLQGHRIERGPSPPNYRVAQVTGRYWVCVGKLPSQGTTYVGSLSKVHSNWTTPPIPITLPFVKPLRKTKEARKVSQDRQQ